MEIESRYVGTRSQPLTVALSPRQTMNYAAALGDGNRHYFDDTRSEGICAPPMLAVALTWPLSSRFDVYWGDSDFPIEAQQRQVHYNERILWNRAMVPDETLTIQGEIVAMTPHPGGTEITIRYEATGRDGGPVFTEYIGGLLRNVTLVDGGRFSDEVPPPIASPEGDTEQWSTSMAIDPLAAHLYDGCTEIVFPIHTSVAFARQVGLPDPIYHGTATLGLAVREILNREGGGDPARLREVRGGFRGMVMPGTSITLRVDAIHGQEGQKIVHFSVVNSEGADAIRNGRVHLDT